MSTGGEKLSTEPHEKSLVLTSRIKPTIIAMRMERQSKIDLNYNSIKESKEQTIRLNGRLMFFSETGTEGGYWAFQDNNFIEKVSPVFGVWNNQIVFDKNNPERQGKTQKDTKVLHKEEWLPLPDPIQIEEDYIKSSLFRGEQAGDKDADKRLMDKYGFEIKYAADRMNEEFGEGNWHLENATTATAPDGTRIYYGGTPSTTPNRPYGVSHGEITNATIEWNDGEIEKRTSDTLLVESRSYDGLHSLENGDQLTIYDKENPQKVMWEGKIDLTKNTTFTEDAFGFWIHNKQKRIQKEKWAKWFFEENPARLELGEKSVKQYRTYRQNKKKT